jgi:hypothetical protein
MNKSIDMDFFSLRPLEEQAMRQASFERLSFGRVAPRGLTI